MNARATTSEPGMNKITVHIPIRTVSETNQREHWRVKAKRVSAQRLLAKMKLREVMKPLLRITVTRIAPRRLDDGNLSAALKAVEDGIQDAIGIDDGSPVIQWVRLQEKDKEYGVRIEIEEIQNGE